MSRLQPDSSTVTWFQIGGYRAQTNQWNRPPLCNYFLGINSIVKGFYDGDEPRPSVRNKHGHLQMTLGIQSDGSSALLLARRKLLELLLELEIGGEHIRNLGSSFPSSQYRSLSHIMFTSKEDFKTKLRSLNSAGKKGPRTGDVSSANKAYAAETSELKRQNTARRRSEFELSRVLWRALYTSEDPTMYRGSWDGTIHGLSTFTFTEWFASLRDAHLELIDAAWSEVTLRRSEHGGIIEDHAITHLQIRENEFLAKKADQFRTSNVESLNDGKTRIVTKSECEELARQHFRTLRSTQRSDPTKPMILLVHNVEMTLRILKQLDVDTGDWAIGLESFLRPGGSGTLRSRSQSLAPRDPREHSPPPPRNRQYSSREETPGQHRYQGDPRGSSSTMVGALGNSPCPSMNMIDIRELYGVLSLREHEISGLRFDGISLREVCVKLGVIDEKRGINAGLDAEYIYEAWQSMAGGSAIDERRQELQSLATKVAEDMPTGSSNGRDGFFEDSDFGLPGRAAAAIPDQDYSDSDDDDD